MPMGGPILLSTRVPRGDAGIARRRKTYAETAAIVPIGIGPPRLWGQGWG